LRGNFARVEGGATARSSLLVGELGAAWERDFSNAIESLNMSLRKAIKIRGAFRVKMQPRK